MNKDSKLVLLSRAPKTTRTTARGSELGYVLNFNRDHLLEYDLGHAISLLKSNAVLAMVDQNHFDLASVVRVDHASQSVDAML